MADEQKKTGARKPSGQIDEPKKAELPDLSVEIAALKEDFGQSVREFFGNESLPADDPSSNAGNVGVDRVIDELLSITRSQTMQESDDKNYDEASPEPILNPIFEAALPILRELVLRRGMTLAPTTYTREELDARERIRGIEERLQKRENTPS